MPRLSEREVDAQIAYHLFGYRWYRARRRGLKPSDDAEGTPTAGDQPVGVLNCLSEL